jgi:hypothetical protein
MAKLDKGIFNEIASSRELTILSFLFQFAVLLATSRVFSPGNNLSGGPHEHSVRGTES